MHEFLMETALLTHGLVSLSDQDILNVWPWETKHLAWVEEGSVRLGSLRDYLPIRNRSKEMIRIDRDTLSTALSEGVSGALTDWRLCCPTKAALLRQAERGSLLRRCPMRGRARYER